MNRLAALASVLPIALTASVELAPKGVSLHPDASAAPSSFTADSSRLYRHGELAVISTDRQLYLLGGRANGVEKVALTGEAGSPRWSPDGQWLAVTVRPTATDDADRPTAVWLVSRSGSVVRKLTPTTADVFHAAAAWSPRSDKLAIEYTAGVGSEAEATQQLDVVDVAGNVTSLATAQNISGFAWSPSGARIAVGQNHFDTSAGKWNSRLVTMSAAGTHRRTVTADLGDLLDVAGWWPDGSGVLVWRDLHGSGAIATDGLPLVDVSAKTGHRRQLAKTMLQYGGWLATSKLRNKVAFIAGGDRIPTNGHKHLVICSRTRCHRIAQGTHMVTFDPAWSVDGQLAAVRDRAIQPNGDYSPTYTQQINSSGGVDLLRHGRLRALAGGEQATAPVWGDKGAMLFVRDSSLWLLRPETKHAVRVAGPIDSSNAFYGFVDWWSSFAWTHAVADNVPLGTPQVI